MRDDTVGSNGSCSVDLYQALSHPAWEARRLLKMGDSWSDDSTPQGLGNETRTRSKQQPSLAEHLGEAGIANLIAAYRDGVTQQQLATKHHTSVSGIKRLIRAHGAQRWRTRTSPHLS